MGHGSDAGDSLLVVFFGINYEARVLHLPLELRHRLHGGAELVAIDQTIAIVLGLPDCHLGIFCFFSDASLLLRVELLAFADQPSLNTGLLVCQPQVIPGQLLVGERSVEEASPILERVAAPALQGALAAQELEMLRLQLRPSPSCLLLLLMLLAGLEPISMLLLLVLLDEPEADAAHVGRAALQHPRDLRVAQPPVLDALRSGTSKAQYRNQFSVSDIFAF